MDIELLKKCSYILCIKEVETEVGLNVESLTLINKVQQICYALALNFIAQPDKISSYNCYLMSKKKTTRTGYQILNSILINQLHIKYHDLVIFHIYVESTS